MNLSLTSNPPKWLNTKLTDFNALRLKAAGDADKLDRILQEECRERCSSKLSDTLKNEGFRFPTLLSAEQSSSDALAEAHAGLVDEGCTVLDMTCGLGIDAFHVARKAAHVTVVDIEPTIAEAARHNADVLGLDNIEVICADSVEWLRNSDRRFDVIFIDPARRADNGGRLYALSACRPEVVAILPLLRGHASKIIIKASPMLDPAQMLSELGGDADIIVFGTSGECKELTAVIPGSGRITAGDITFTAGEEHEAIADYAVADDINGYIYEPSAIVMKAAPYKLISSRYGLLKLDRNTHLYSSDRLAADFPGRIYKIDKVLKMGNKAVRELSGIEADVAVRNFPMTADALKKKLKIKRGGDGRKRLFGVTVRNERMLILTSSLPESSGY